MGCPVRAAELLRIQASAMPEEDVAAHVVDLCQTFGVLRFHVPDSRWMRAGWPDECLIGPSGVLFRELKSQRGRVRPEQARVIDLMRSAGLDAGYWRPDDLLSGDIRRSIQAISRRGVSR